MSLQIAYIDIRYQSQLNNTFVALYNTPTHHFYPILTRPRSMHDKYIKMASLQKHLHKLEDPDNDGDDATPRMKLEQPSEDDVKKD